MTKIDVTRKPVIRRSRLPEHYGKFSINFFAEDVPQIGWFDTLAEVKAALIEIVGKEQYDLWFPESFTDEDLTIADVVFNELHLAKQLLIDLAEDRKRLANNRQVPIHELEILVFSTYLCGMISEGKACQILNLDRPEFRKQWQEWGGENPKMIAIFNGVLDET